MKKSIVVSIVVYLISGIVIAQQPQPQQPNQKFSESIQIKSDNDKVMAVVDVSGKVTLSTGSSYDEVINTLIIRMIKQNSQAIDQIQMLSKLVEDARSRANATTQKAAEIFQIWNPPQQPKQEVKKEEPKPVVKKEEPKKTFWEKLTGK